MSSMKLFPTVGLKTVLLKRFCLNTCHENVGKENFCLCGYRGTVGLYFGSPQNISV